MTSERIKEIQLETAYPNSVSVQQALFKVWNECEQAKAKEKEQQNNLPIHIHEGISNTHVYIEDGVVHVKPNETFK
jgi:hypothetical protein